jgi:hypothetical protein
MTDSSNSPDETLSAAFAGAFPRYLTEKVGGFGVEVTAELAATISAATTGLETSLADLLAVPPAEQEQSPLELVRTTTLPITRLLSEAGVPQPKRDADEAEIHPEDLYGLYPATSRDLGEQAWQAHMQWGIEKARLVAGLVPAADTPAAPMPTVALFGLSAERRDAVAAAAQDRGYGTLVWRNPAALADEIGKKPTVVLVDLGHPSAHDAVRQLVAAGIRVVVVGDRIDDFATAGVLALGAEAAVDLDRLLDRIPSLLPHIV